MSFKSGEIEEALRGLGTPDPPGATSKLEEYAEMAAGKRRWAGLTSARLPEGISGWILDSLTVVRVLECLPMRVLDIGSGGGLLGVVLAVACPALSVSMVESSSRKAAFLAEVIGALELERAEVINARAGDLVGSRKFDVCVSRAAGRLPLLVPSALNLLEPGGRYVALKQASVDEEVREAAREIAAAGARLSVLGPSETGRPGVSLVVVSKL